MVTSKRAIKSSVVLFLLFGLVGVLGAVDQTVNIVVNEVVLIAVSGGSVTLTVDNSGISGGDTPIPAADATTYLNYTSVVGTETRSITIVRSGSNPPSGTGCDSVL